MRLIILASFVLLGVSGASGATLTTLYSFCAKANCADGRAPLDGVIQDASGNLYGTTAEGGRHPESGTVFELVKSGTTSTHKVLHHFCAEPDCADGSRPYAGLIRDAAGNLYGTTTEGGANNGGVAFELSPQGNSWRIKVLYNFCVTGCSAGQSPFSLTYAGAASGVPYDGISPLYGVTTTGGAHDAGTVFQLAQTAGSWSESVLYSFCSQALCSDGRIPGAGLLADGDGHLFGTTSQSDVTGGTGGSGVAFELTKGSGNTWSETVLHDFCPTEPCTDAMDPDTALVMDGAGNLYGTGATGGGHHSSGAVFKIVPNGTSSQESVLYGFCVLSKCPDGRSPTAGLVMDGSGNLFGATSNGGVRAQTAGVIFELNGLYQVIYEFCSIKRCKDGALPQGHVIMDGAGNLFGTTVRGGLHGGSDPRNEDAGTVYELTP
jgi:uncharacterized repeat protein (TIGR03803 family)